ncbi:hypothetical protein QBK99_11245 [Corticibacterium sp. UT-5YL-CI-8]|nr:hypothetical protein [Tianweitania sp. UT-5YL-CI-8]
MNKPKMLLIPSHLRSSPVNPHQEQFDKTTSELWAHCGEAALAIHLDRELTPFVFGLYQEWRSRF